jgi:hypothetical protein
MHVLPEFSRAFVFFLFVSSLSLCTYSVFRSIPDSVCTDINRCSRSVLDVICVVSDITHIVYYHAATGKSLAYTGLSEHTKGSFMDVMHIENMKIRWRT